ncbi:MAG: hypothetical protein JXA82_03555 [Sedimentisphaerales bacterium]|nr:hypothetical protein [Sedimentisphaerales bacterium]
METSDFEKQLNDLVNEFGSIPEPNRSKIILLARRKRESEKKLKKSMEDLQSALDYLRVCVKYMMFDLEATRRENQYLRKLLEDKK